MWVRSILLKKGLRADRIWFWRPLRMRFGWRIACALDRLALARSQYWPQREIRLLQLERLQEVLRDASRILFWRERFAQSDLDPFAFDDAAQIGSLPLNVKSDFTTRHFSEYTKPKWIGRLLRNNTSGSTGAPLKFYQDGQYELRQYAVCDRMLRTAVGGRAVPPLAIRSRVRAGFSLDSRHFFFVRGYNGIKHRFPELRERIRSYKGRVILYGFSSALLELARECERRGESIRCAAIVASGEALQASQREEMRRIFGAEVYLCYTTSELGWLAFECEHHRLHLNEESAYVEITDDEGVPLPDGEEGRIVVTPFDTRVMPFIRYDTGDRGVIRDGECPCGRTLRVIEVWGRRVEYLSFGADRTVSLLDVSATFDSYSHAVQQFQIIQNGETSVRIKIIPRRNFASAQESIAQALQNLIHPQLAVQWEITDEIPEGPNGKAVYFVRDM